jgi:ATP-binding protein involved in chromosome partitioning
MQPSAIPAKLDLKKDKGLTIVWADGRTSTFDLATLRSMCPCAKCKEERDESAKSKSLLKVLPGNYTQDLKIASAELVGNYAIKLAWTDGHDTGIYSFTFLRELGGL